MPEIEVTPKGGKGRLRGGGVGTGEGRGGGGREKEDDMRFIKIWDFIGAGREKKEARSFFSGHPEGGRAGKPPRQAEAREAFSALAE